jgi:hypothetical protein
MSDNGTFFSSWLVLLYKISTQSILFELRPNIFISNWNVPIVNVKQSCHFLTVQCIDESGQEREDPKQVTTEYNKTSIYTYKRHTSEDMMNSIADD